MFRPDNGSDNIYVTLEIVVWSWSASSGKGSDGVWTGPAFSIPPPSDPSESEEFPVWENTYLP